ncbi:single-stranded-DNA-specific exonuclease RecJ, partial [Patescibacteria group bacterium]|nr:single-stranded-DNA-specific exonuclease RecJ [Patescibacteria group bacterium]
IANKEKIIVFADYDADGICGSTVLHDFLKEVGADFETFIPDRFREPFGLTEDRVRQFHSAGAKLVITVDFGVTDYDEVELANSLGLDVIILDHHIVPPRWPNAYAVVDHKQPDDAYPSKVLCGTGLAFKLVQGILAKERYGLMPGWEKWLLDVVAIATVADMVPLIQENRTLLHYGLKVLQKTRRIGLQKLFEKSGVAQNRISEETIGFSIAPKINASSRMDHSNTSFELLTTMNEKEAEWLVERVWQSNEERRKIVEEILAKIKLRLQGMLEIPKIIFEGAEGWPPGVLGIVANRLVELYQRPSFVYSVIEQGVVKGSCRSALGVNVVSMMRTCEDVLSDFGGHDWSGGFSTDVSKLSALEEKIIRYPVEINGVNGSKPIEIDMELDLQTVGWNEYHDIKKMAPFGIANPEPLFLAKYCEVGRVRLMGEGERHARIVFKNIPYEAIAFFRGADLKNIKEGDRIDIVFAMQANRWNGNEKLEMRMVDFCLCA